jgi:integrase/recombinase XerD
MDAAIKQLDQDLARASYAESTRLKYCAHAQEFALHLGKPITEASRDEVRAFIDAVMAREGGVSKKHERAYALMFLFRKTLGRPEMVSFIKLPKRHSALPVVLSKKEVHRLLNAFRSPRHQAIAMVMYGAGLRVSEAVALTISDIDGPRNVLIVRRGKGGKPREVKLSPALYDWLRAYWSRTRPALPYLFAGVKGRPPLTLTVRQAIAAAAAQAGIKKRVTPHVLRHCFATHLLEEGTDVRVVSALLGHARLETTARYARVTQKLIRQTPSPLDLLPQQRW